jgi:heptose I phosphotransferase
MSQPQTGADRFLSEEVAALIPGDDLLGWAMSVPGEVVRQVPGRSTRRISLNGKTYFLKLHQGVGWGEIIKNWLSFKQPVLGARNEFRACRYLQQRDIAAPRVAAFAESVGPPWARLSFIVTRSLGDMEDLETVSLRWQQTPPGGQELRTLTMQVARIARQLHEAGVVHRDFYICHLLRQRQFPQAPLAVLDLHRALLFEQVPVRWRLRDLAALLFSTLDLPLGKRAWLRFVRVYTGQPLRVTFEQQPEFWHAVVLRAQKLQRKARRKGLTPGGG